MLPCVVTAQRLRPSAVSASATPDLPPRSTSVRRNVVLHFQQFTNVLPLTNHRNSNPLINFPTFAKKHPGAGFRPNIRNLAPRLTHLESISYMEIALNSIPVCMLQLHSRGTPPLLQKISRLKSPRLPEVVTSFIVEGSPGRFCPDNRDGEPSEEEDSRHTVWCRSHRRIHRSADAAKASYRNCGRD